MESTSDVQDRPSPGTTIFLGSLGPFNIRFQDLISVVPSPYLSRSVHLFWDLDRNEARYRELRVGVVAQTRIDVVDEQAGQLAMHARHLFLSSFLFSASFRFSFHFIFASFYVPPRFIFHVFLFFLFILSPRSISISMDVLTSAARL